MSVLNKKGNDTKQALGAGEIQVEHPWLGACEIHVEHLWLGAGEIHVEHLRLGDIVGVCNGLDTCPQHNSGWHQPNNWAQNTLGEAGDAIYIGGSCNAPHRNRWNMTWARRQHTPEQGTLGIDAHDQLSARGTEDWCNELGNTAHCKWRQQWKNIQIGDFKLT